MQIDIAQWQLEGTYWVMLPLVEQLHLIPPLDESSAVKMIVPVVSVAAPSPSAPVQLGVMVIVLLVTATEVM